MAMDVSYRHYSTRPHIKQEMPPDIVYQALDVEVASVDAHTCVASFTAEVQHGQQTLLPRIEGSIPDTSATCVVWVSSSETRHKVFTESLGDPRQERQVLVVNAHGERVHTTTREGKLHTYPCNDTRHTHSSGGDTRCSSTNRCDLMRLWEIALQRSTEHNNTHVEQDDQRNMRIHRVAVLCYEDDGECERDAQVCDQLRIADCERLAAEVATGVFDVVHLVRINHNATGNGMHNTAQPVNYSNCDTNEKVPQLFTVTHTNTRRAVEALLGTGDGFPPRLVPVEWTLCDASGDEMPLHHVHPTIIDHVFEAADGKRSTFASSPSPACKRSTFASSPSPAKPAAMRLRQKNAQTGTLSMLLRTETPLASCTDLHVRLVRRGHTQPLVVFPLNATGCTTVRRDVPLQTTHLLSVMSEWETFDDIPVARLVSAYEKLQPQIIAWQQRCTQYQSRSEDNIDVIVRDTNTFVQQVHARAVQRVHTGVQRMLYGHSGCAPSALVAKPSVARSCTMVAPPVPTLMLGGEEECEGVYRSALLPRGA